MVHGDDQGLVLPPRLAPFQAVIVPIYKNDDEKSSVMEAVCRVRAELGDFRVHLDAREGLTPGYKFNHWELRGVPLRIEIGPKDVQKGTVALARRDRLGKEGKSFAPQAGLSGQVAEALADIQASLFDKALAFRRANTYDPQDHEDFKVAVEKGWAFSWWCERAECEAEIKAETKATTRCIPLEQPGGEGRCLHCGLPARRKAIFAKAY